jgi:hypothetical protein
MSVIFKPIGAGGGVITETDPVFVASPAAGITAPLISNWNTAFGWGNHSSAGYLLSATAATTYQPLDGDLTSIGSLAGTTGLLRKTAANTWSLDTATYLTGNQSITMSGDASGTGTTAIALTLSNTGVTASTYQSVTVDAKGRVTAGTNPTTLSGYGITDAQPLAAVLTNTTASFTTAQETKLAGIATGAEVNVNADWNAVSGDAQILNKPTLGTAAATNSTDYATSAQGAKADTAVQPAAIGSTILAYDANLQTFVNTFTLPTTDGTSGQSLVTNGAGALSFATVSGGGASLTDIWLYGGI